MTVFDVISLFGGLALFLYGMRIMGDGLQHGSSGALKKAMEKVTNSPVIGFLLGTLVTAVIQSSTATIVITSGLVGAGIITLHQSLGIILGANVGTTITGQIIRLLDLNAGATSWLNMFKPSTLAPVAAIIGILLIMAFRFHNSDTIGGIAMGFGILFTGLLNMTAAITPLSQSEAFANILLRFANSPILGFLVGAGVAFAIQSSSATVGILQALSITGQLTFGSIYAMILGIYLGDCVTTAIVCSIGAKADAKRTGIVHILFNLTSMVLIVILVSILHSAGVFGSFWTDSISSGGIANVHSVFKLGSAIVLLPACGLFEKLSYRIVRDDVSDDESSAELQRLDEKFFSAPALALSATHDAVSKMGHIAGKNTVRAVSLLNNYNRKVADKITEKETQLDSLADGVSAYLLRLSPHMDPDDHGELLNYYLQCVTEFERIGDYAENLSENAAVLLDKGTPFSPKAQKELELLGEAVTQILEYARDAFKDQDAATARHIEPLEEVIDDLVEQLRANHTRRLRDGKCAVYAGLTFLDVLVNMERIADQCSNIGLYTISLNDSAVQKTRHEYIQHLHQGEDPAYNEEFKRDHDTYFERYRVIEES